MYYETALVLWDAQRDWIRYLAWETTWDQMIYLKVKSNKWKSHAEVRCEGRSNVGLCMKKDENLSNYQGPDHSIYQAPVLYEVQLGFQAIVYLNLQHLLNFSLNSQRPTGLVNCIILMHLYHPNTPHDSRRAPAEVFTSDQVKSKATYSSGLGATGLLPRPLSFSLFWLSWRWSWRSHKEEVLSCV